MEEFLKQSCYLEIRGESCTQPLRGFSITSAHCAPRIETSGFTINVNREHNSCTARCLCCRRRREASRFPYVWTAGRLSEAHAVRLRAHPRHPGLGFSPSAMPTRSYYSRRAAAASLFRVSTSSCCFFSPQIGTYNRRFYLI